MTAKNTVLTAARLRSLLHYDRKTGKFRWRVNKSQKRAGDIAGCLNKKTGYWLVRIDRQLYLAHVMAWLYVKGKWPPDEIDHKDRIGSHNQWANLRLGSSAKNKMNATTRSDNQLGRKGVSGNYGHWLRKPYRARIQKDGKQILIGRFATPEEAAAAYAAKAIEMFGEFAHLGGS